LHPLPGTGELEDLHAAGVYRSGSGERFNPLGEWLVSRSRIARQRRITRFIRQGSILDIGCGRGLFLDLMRKAGWSVMGTEVSPAAAGAVREARGIPVVSGDPQGWGLRDGTMDVITLSHVLEHLLRPAQMIEECSRLLKPGGLLLCAVPNMASLQARVGRGAWFHLDIPRHVHHFSDAGLIRLLEAKGFAAMRVRRFAVEYDPFGWLQTLLNLSGVRRNWLYEHLQRPSLRDREPAGKAGTGLLLTALLLPVYLPLAFLLSLVDSYVLRRGGSVEVLAYRKEG
jgi:2-polyprenyl-3-methyl-5-hydroxy-6-metoxy-1,4-benzoquinol methylase